MEKHEASLPSQDNVSMVSTIDRADDLEANNNTPHLEQAPKDKHFNGILSNVLSRVRSEDAYDPGPPPDGGLTAWTQVALAHLVIFNTWGFINSFGLFQDFYVNSMHLGNASQVSWIGSLQIFISFALGPFSGRLTVYGPRSIDPGISSLGFLHHFKTLANKKLQDAGFFRLVFVTGSVLQLFEIFMTSLCKTYWQLLLAQGVCVGVGNGLSFVPSVALASTYFLKNRSMALGVTGSGTATGGLVFPAIAQRLLPTIGFAWTVRVMGFIMLFGTIAAALLFKPRLPPRKSGPIVEWTAFAELPYMLFSMSTFFLFWGVYVGFYCVGSFARDVLGANQTTSINLLLTMNGVGLPARLVPAYFSDRMFGPLNTIMPLTALSGVVLYSWIVVDTMTGVWIFAAIYDSLAAAVQGLFPAVLTSLTKDPMKANVRAGMGFGVAGLASFSGPPLAGAVIEKASGSYIYAQIFSASSMMVALLTLIICRWSLVGFELKAKI